MIKIDDKSIPEQEYSNENEISKVSVTGMNVSWISHLIGNIWHE